MRIRADDAVMMRLAEWALEFVGLLGRYLSVLGFLGMCVSAALGREDLTLTLTRLVSLGVSVAVSAAMLGLILGRGSRERCGFDDHLMAASLSGMCLICVPAQVMIGVLGCA